jgi:hypothetical protein
LAASIVLMPQAQLLHKPVLQRLVGALNAALRLWGVGADDVNVELIERPAELGPLEYTYNNELILLSFS